jgi:exopolysaccharide biosynthesis polyprenyl glycosylphosphotransferase
MLKQKARAVAYGVILLEIALTALALPLAHWLRDGLLAIVAPGIFGAPLYPLSRYLLLLPFIVPFWAIGLWAVGFHRSHRTDPIRVEAWGAIQVALGGTASVALLVWALRWTWVSRPFLVLFAAVDAALLAGEKVVLRLLSRSARRRGYNFRTVVIAGTGKRAVSFGDFLEKHPHWGFKVIGFLDDGNGGEIAGLGRWPRLGHLRELEGVLAREVVDEIIFVIEKGRLEDFEEAMLAAERHGVRSHLALDIFPHVIARPMLEEMGGVPLLTFTTTPSNPLLLATKRAIDIVLALGLLVLSLPVQLLAACAIKLSSPGPVLFRQTRCGLNGRHFTLTKFRTMVSDAEQRRAEVAPLNEMDGPVFKSRTDPRLTSVGRLLRRFSVDELPQLWNVLVGDMSLVGPRPPLPEEVARYEPWQRRRLSMKPGLTCLWQISGRNDLPDFDRWMELDLKYIDSWSPLLDLKILARTVPTVLSGRGAR